MITIRHISDLHFHFLGSNSETNNLLDKVKAMSNANDWLLLTGDIADDGDKWQYKKAAAALKAFAPNILMTPGNHDYGWVGNFYDSSTAKSFDNFLVDLCGDMYNKVDYFNKIPFLKEITDGETNVLAIGLNSCAKTESLQDLAEGEIGEAQRGALRSLLDNPKYQSWYKLVFLHHHPMKLDWSHEKIFGLKDSDQFMGLVKDRVHIIAFGHTGGGLKDSVTEDFERNVSIIKEASPIIGVQYFLNANYSVCSNNCLQITFEPGNISVTIK